MKEAALLSRLRKICLALPEVRETVKWGHPTFEAGKKMFAVLDQYDGRPCLALRAAPNGRTSTSRTSGFSRLRMPLASAGCACVPIFRSTGARSLNWCEVAIARLP
jgi:hypothetical protein